jgi:dTMP kinase
MHRGLFISLDGIDGTGKSTQCQRLARWLESRGLAVRCCADPGGTSAGDVIRTLLLEHRGDLTAACEAFLFMASRAQLVAEVIRPALEQGQAVVCDRFLLANVVYQGYAGGLEPALLWKMGELATGGLMPDLTIVLDLPLDVAMARRARPADRMERKDRAYHERTRAGFLAEAALQPERIKTVDASRPVEQVEALVLAEVARVVAANRGT